MRSQEKISTRARCPWDDTSNMNRGEGEIPGVRKVSCFVLFLCNIHKFNKRKRLYNTGFKTQA